MRKGCDGEEKKWKLGESLGHTHSIYPESAKPGLDSCYDVKLGGS